ncbi:NAD-binding Rossmann fold oxidoreductase family protein [Didymella exigua CBS 183.55]|uniref:NAD-binding Rossmann fold oxidoreductase family protein n=1 Tax=Didymella exigua CBS 183.55 TaxID=1150837 RepID=A0A6A5R325_9PLEO|nr:NAD-binding Rossmann fold oxidoreductase family protein [Didymella exigua CBS 183.55]KAF1922465.1 NAD-binding Rossmann fold oxidoreductase family protein [Didymella exigua CBS 183.55]
MPEVKRIGLIGLSAKGSWASQSHLPYLQQTSHYKVTALQNSSKASAEAAAIEYSLSDVAAYAEPSAIASDSNVDIVAVIVNVPEHYHLTKPAIEAGKDVFVEWPLGRNLAEAEELTQLAKKKGIKTMIGLQARQNPSIIKAKEIVESGKLGRILTTTMFGHGTVFGSTIHEGFLYGLPVEAGANLLTIPFGHAVDALCYVLGEMEDISASLANLRPELDLIGQDGKPARRVSKTAHDHVSITGQLLNGGGIVSVTYAGGESRSNRDFVWEIIGTEGTLILEGPRMGGHVQMYQPTIKIAASDTSPALYGETPHAKQELEVVKVETAAHASFNVGRAWDAWAGVGLDKGNSVTTFEDALLRHKMIDAIYRSAETGKKENYV